MENTNSEICSPIDPGKRSKEIQEGLCALFKRQLSDEELAEMVNAWGNYVRGYHKAKTIDAESERERLGKIITKLKTGREALNELKKFDMQRFNRRYELSGRLNKQDDAIVLIGEQIRLANETLACTYQKNNVSINQKKLELHAMIYLFVIAKKKYGLKPCGKGKINPVLEFVRIISGIQDNQRIDRHYKKYKKWKEHPETLP